jgi:transposase-like protein
MFLPRVINVDKNPAYPAAIKELNGGPSNGQTSRLARDGYGSFHNHWRTLQSIEAINMISEGQNQVGKQRKIRLARRGSWPPVRNRA